MIYLVMTKSFDHVFRRKLLIKVKSYVKYLFLAWLFSYLTSRIQEVNVNKTIPKHLTTTSGVIQGGAPCPSLLLLRIDDIFHTIGHGINFLLADDKNCRCFCPRDYDFFIDNIKYDLLSLHSWYTD